MRELSQDWRDLLQVPWIAFDLRKLLLCAACLVLQLVGVELILYHTTRAAGIAAGFAAEPEIWRGVHVFQLYRFREFVRDVWEMPGGKQVLAVMFGMAYAWCFYVFAHFGGAVFRMTAVEIATRDRIPMAEARRFARQKFRAFFWTQGIVVLAIALFLGTNALGGLVGRIPAVGPTLVALFFWLAVGAGACAVLLALGLVLGGDLMLATVAVEGTDQFDAISRGFNYVFVRPWRYLAYRLVGIGSGAAAFAVVLALAALAYGVALWTVSLGMGDDFGRYLSDPLQFVYYSCTRGEVPADLDRRLDLAGAKVSGGVLVFVSLCYGFLVAGYGLSLFVGLATTTYYLLRRAIDGTDVTEVYLAGSEKDLDLGAELEEELETVPKAKT